MDQDDLENIDDDVIFNLSQELQPKKKKKRSQKKEVI